MIYIFSLSLSIINHLKIHIQTFSKEIEKKEQK